MIQTIEREVMFTEQDVHTFLNNLGDNHTIYKNKENAREFGYEEIPLPPTMPFIAYRELHAPWKFIEPIILRKQQCDYHQTMYVNRPYKVLLSLDKTTNRKPYTFVKQTLSIIDKNQKLCYSSVSHLVVGGIE
ncbi:MULTISPECIES: FAS1-like dehydratase domain-containing protein [Bacillus]|uniref:FAS1-like dehydratase domain-containing protein n=1 Tax=Bacillus TaxID=1386 RepID=UPI0002E1DC3E|nr:MULTISPECIES: MaoC family dehydratase N-terminal domain-containing protein [Bacillus]